MQKACDVPAGVLNPEEIAALSKAAGRPLTDEETRCYWHDEVVFRLHRSEFDRRKQGREGVERRRAS